MLSICYELYGLNDIKQLPSREFNCGVTVYKIICADVFWVPSITIARYYCFQEHKLYVIDSFKQSISSIRNILN
jgi:hypothetical protein